MPLKTRKTAVSRQQAPVSPAPEKQAPPIALYFIPGKRRAHDAFSVVALDDKGQDKALVGLFPAADLRARGTMPGRLREVFSFYAATIGKNLPTERQALKAVSCGVLGLTSTV